MKNQFSHIIFIDIETASQASTFDKLTEAMQSLWLKKAKLLSSDEAVSPAELYYDRAGIYAEFGKIVCISIGFLHFKDGELQMKIRSIVDHDEQTLLHEFKSIMARKLDETKIQLCAHNGKEFDFPYLARRMLINGIALPSYLELSGKKPWDVQHIDTLQLWKFGDWKNYTSLELLTQVFNIETPKTDIDGSDVNRVYHLEDDLQRIGQYCAQDVLATARVYLRLKGLVNLDISTVEFC